MIINLVIAWICCTFELQIKMNYMQDFWFNVNYGLNHVLDINGYDHVLFLMVLAVPYVFKDWRPVLILVSLFTLGHTLSLVLAAYDIVKVNGTLVEFLIPMTILVAAVYNVFTAGKAPKSKGSIFLCYRPCFLDLFTVLVLRENLECSSDRPKIKCFRFWSLL